MDRSDWRTGPPGRVPPDPDQLRTLVQGVFKRVAPVDNEVVAVIGAGATLTGLELGTSFLRREPHVMGEVIARTIAVAEQQSREELAESMAELSGGRGGPTFLAALTGGMPAAPIWASVADAAPDDFEPNQMDDALARLRSRARQQVEAYQELENTLTRARTTVRSADGAVAVTVGSGGAVEAVEVGRVDRYDAVSFGATVLTALQRARATAAMATARQAEQALGGQLNLIDLVDSAIPEGLRAQIRDEGSGDEGLHR